MKSEFSTSWIPNQKNSSSTPVRQHQTQLHQSNSHHLSHPLPHPLPPSSPLLTPRTAAPTNRAISFAASFRSVFNRDRDRTPHRAASANSLRSAYSANSSTKPPSHNAHSDSSSLLHPYAAMVAAPLPVVSSHDASDEEEECPVCLEPLSSSFRLPGEKPHIVPECGHALHEVSPCLPCCCCCRRHSPSRLRHLRSPYAAMCCCRWDGRDALYLATPLSFPRPHSPPRCF